MSRSATAFVPALVVPDEQTWTMGGRDPAALGLEPAFAAAHVQRVLVPERVPEPLVGPLGQILDDVPPDIERPAALRSGTDEHGGHDGHAHEGHDHHQHGADGHHGHEGHDHHDMMAIVGEPSADGLVMEPLELHFGPLATPLPGGLLVAVTLDGDVVAECDVSALLEAETTDAPPDPMAPQAWQAVLDAAGEAAGGIAVPPSERWNRVARIEVERALSHMAWLRTFARALGWQGLVDRATHGISAALEAQGLSEPALREAANVVAETARFLEGSRLLRLRTAGRAPLDREPARVLGLEGPVARASGVVVDARLDDPLYRILGFEPVIGSEGDAHARTLVRAAEAVQALELAARACAKERSSDLGDALPDPAPLAVVEGPRGPLQARIDGSGRRLAVPGHEAARAAAGRAVVGFEWSAAVVGLSSFDLSPWRVSG